MVASTAEYRELCVVLGFFVLLVCGALTLEQGAARRNMAQAFVSQGGAADVGSEVSVSYGIFGVFQNSAFLAGLVGFALAQIAKLFTHWYATSEWKWTRVVGSGGMPSSHTSLVVGLTTAVGVRDGTSSDLFAICLVFALVVMYDASGVRLQAGKHANLLNLIITQLPPDHPVQEQPVTLKDTIGHTPVQVVAGAVLGVVSGLIFQASWNAAHKGS